MSWLSAVLRTIRADIAEYRKAASAARHRRPTRLERLLDRIERDEADREALKGDEGKAL